MPADREEIEQLIDEGIDILELAKPDSLVVENGKLRALRCTRTQYTGDRDTSGRKIPHDIPGSDFEVPLDTLIMAISQHAILDFLEDVPVTLNDRGYIEVEPMTFETSVPGVFAGGDVANEGPSSIVKAAAAGKAIADSILRRQRAGDAGTRQSGADVATIMRRRGEKQQRIPTPQIDPRERRNFDEVVLTYTDAQARTEASRCLDCDTFCSLCVGVCPNFALQTYAHDAFSIALPRLQPDGDDIRATTGDLFSVSQPHQVAVLTDLCNECGNCTTFCPTSGQPYRDKPRLYVDREDFEAQHDNAFLVSAHGDRWTMAARWQDATHRIELNETLDYYAPAFSARLDPQSFEVIEATSTGNEGSFSLQPCAEMYVLLKGIRQSIPYLPRADGNSLSGKIAHPGYEE